MLIRIERLSAELPAFPVNGFIIPRGAIDRNRNRSPSSFLLDRFNYRLAKIVSRETQAQWQRFSCMATSASTRSPANRINTEQALLDTSAGRCYMSCRPRIPSMNILSY